MSLSQNYPTTRPTLTLDFAKAKRVDPRVTFTRASTATYFDASGTLRSAANNAPRIDFDPATLLCQGLLIEEQRTNLLPYSAEFDNAAWATSNVSVTANVTAAPDGSVTAEKLISANGFLGFLVQSISQSAGLAYTHSVFAKAGEYSFCQLRINTSVSSITRAYFNLATGTVAASTNCVANISSVGGGWFRCSITYNATISASGGQRVYGQQTAVDTDTGDGTSGIFIWGAQLEAGAFPTSYIPTTTTALTRAADVASVNTLSPWFNASEGTLFAEGTVVDNISGTTARVFGLFSDPSAANIFVVEARSSTSTRARITIGGVRVTPSDSVDVLGVNAKLAGAYGADGATICVNGRSPVTLASSLPSGLTTLFLGQNTVPTAGSIANGYLRRIAYYNTRLPDAQLQALTAP